jgi:uncharacterized protein (TIGR03000 family)
MYSIALLMALSGGNEVVDRHHGGGCCGCQGAVQSCGCGGGHRHHRGGHHRRHGGCCGYEQSCGCCGNVQPVSCGCCGTGAGYGAPAPASEPVKAMPKPKTTQAAAPATILVELPADATLKVDGAATSSISALRVLVSPELPMGKEFQYTLTAQAVREGKAVQVERTITVRGGEESRVSLSLPVAVAVR